MTASSTHLSYCMNVHPGETWAEAFAALQEFAPSLRQLLQDNGFRHFSQGRFGLGLRLSAAAAATLHDSPRDCLELTTFCEREFLYPFTVNAFPYGRFHGTRVKEEVYRPDWSTPERLDYSCQCADVLAAILPADLPCGSISTVPIGYRTLMREEQIEEAEQQLCRLVRHLHRLEAKTGKCIRFALEPEPACVLDTIPSILEFFARFYARGPEKLAALSGLPASGSTAGLLRRHLGLCLDTCHHAVQFEDPGACLRAFAGAAIPVVKVHLSAAPILAASDRDAAAAFAEPVYLHQTFWQTSHGRIAAAADLPEALAADASSPPVGELRTHFHIPLSLPDRPGLRSTACALTPDFFRALAKAGVEHAEIETYTFAVLPPALRRLSLTQALAADLLWADSRLDPPPPRHRE